MSDQLFCSSIISSVARTPIESIPTEAHFAILLTYLSQRNLNKDELESFQNIEDPDKARIAHAGGNTYVLYENSFERYIKNERVGCWQLTFIEE